LLPIMHVTGENCRFGPVPSTGRCGNVTSPDEINGSLRLVITDPHWSSSVYGNYSAVRHDGTAKANICANYTTAGKAVSADYVCNPDFNVSQLGFVTRWVPVKNLTFSAEVQWFHLDQKFQGTALLAPAAPKPTTRYEFKDQDTVQLELRVQRNF
jgi:hypothetical protein